MQKVAVIGAGFIGQTHIASYKMLENVVITAVVDANQSAAEKAAAEAGCAWYSELSEALCKAEIDIVDICLPTFLHEECVIASARAGKHVLCEKPVTFTLESFDRMAKACEEKRVKFMVAQVVRWHPEYVRIREMIQNGELGELRMVYEKRISQHPGWSEWFKDPAKSGGGLFDLHVHDIDYLYSVFGMPEKVSAVGWKSESGCWNHVSSRLTWANGLNAVCEGSIAMTGEFPFSVEFRANGDKGSINYLFSAGHNLKDGENLSEFRYFPQNAIVHELDVPQCDMYTAELADFVDAVEQEEPVPILPAESRKVLEIVMAIKASLENGGESVKV